MTYTMKVYKDVVKDTWMVRSDDPEMKELFGTDVIPTAFRACAPPKMVLAGLRALNPDDHIQIRIGDRWEVSA